MADTPNPLDAIAQDAETAAGFKPTLPRELQPLGVPRGYRAPDRGQRRESAEIQQLGQDIFPGEQSYAQGIAPRYTEGDLDWIAGLSPERLTQLQYQLKNTGLIKTFYKGYWTENEDQAMAAVFAYANRQGLLWEDALEDFAANAELVGGPAGASGPSFTARLSNPDDLKKAFTQSLYDAQGGRFMDDTQMQQMIDAYQQIEYGAQRAAFDNAGTVVDPPTAQTFAAEQAKTADPAGVEAAKYSDYASVFEDLIGM
jgi:hypothetical protein